jgi:AcrR family transcriptional regulator
MSSMKRESDTKRDRILAAAQECFLLYGFKRTAMDDIARAADISRAALYLLFPNKEAIFRTLSEQIHDAALARVKAALQTEGSIEERLIPAFEGKYLAIMELVQSGAHGSELIEVNHGLGADIVQQALHSFESLITEAIREAAGRGEITLERVGLSAEECAALLTNATNGLKGAQDLGFYRQQLRRLIHVFCVSLAPVG